MRSLEELEAMIDGIRDAPTGTGVVELLVRRPAVDEREVVKEIRLDVDEGLVGDTWRARGAAARRMARPIRRRSSP